MASFEQHCMEAFKVFGDRYEHVHRWLDGLAIVAGRLDINHHRHRHHTGGITIVERQWGETAGKVARQHIKKDEGRIYTEEEMKKIYPDCSEWMEINHFEDDK